MRSFKRAAVLAGSTALLTVAAASCGSDDDSNDTTVPVVPASVTPKSVVTPDTVAGESTTTMGG